MDGHWIYYYSGLCAVDLLRFSPWWLYVCMLIMVFPPSSILLVSTLHLPSQISFIYATLFLLTYYIPGAGILKIETRLGIHTTVLCITLGKAPSVTAKNIVNTC
jgi:hypothetical protein